MNKQYDVKKIVGLLWSKLWVILVFVVVGTLLGFGVTKLFMPVLYESHTSMYVKCISNDETSIGQNDLNLSKSLVGTYIVVLQDDTVMEVIGDELLEKYSVEELSHSFSFKDGSISEDSLRSAITMTAVNETEVMRISSVTANPQLSADLCNIVAAVSPDFLVRVVGAGSVEAIGTAKPNAQPISPNVTRNTALGALVGLMISIFLIMLVDFFDNTIKDTETLNQKYSKAIIGEVQAFAPKKEEKKQGKADEPTRTTILDKTIPFAITEAYKAMRTNLVFALSTAKQKIVAVSSPNPGEGKSTSAANLAIALAQMEHHVLLIDADMRKPVQHKMFHVQNQTGLSSAIGRLEDVDNCIRKQVSEHLDLMPSGPKPPNPSELLGSEQATEILTKLSQQYDYIILDTPPVNVVSDVIGISESIAGVLIVLCSGKTTFEEAESAMKKLELAKENLLGFVLNDVHKNHGGAYYNYKNYKYKYKYKSGYSNYGYGYGTTDEGEDEKKTKKSV